MTIEELLRILEGIRGDDEFSEAESLQENELEVKLEVTQFMNSSHKLQERLSPKMDNANVLNQMAEYNFNLPIHATIIFDESDTDSLDKNEFEDQVKTLRTEIQNKKASHNIRGPVNLNDIKNTETLNINDKTNNIENFDSKKIHNNEHIVQEIIKKSLNKNTEIKNKVHTIENENNKEANKISNNTERNQTDNVSNQYAKTLSPKTPRNPVESVSVHHQELSEIEPTITICAEDLLDKLSDYILLIMESFYNYVGKQMYRSNVLERQKRQKLYQTVKFHFFELSYYVMESIIIPQERNVSFITQFLNNTVAKANKKFQKRKYQMCHILPIFNELLVWAKQKQAGLIFFSNDENRREYLNKNPQPPFQPHCHKSQSSDTLQAPNQENNVCIFASGIPGKEISINIIPETLLINNENRYNNYVELSRKEKSPNYVAKERALAPPPYRSHHNITQNYNSVIQNPLTNNMDQNSKNIHHQTSYNIQKDVQLVQNYYQNGETVVQNNEIARRTLQDHLQQNVAQPVQTGLSRVQELNTTRTTDIGYVNYLHDNRNYNLMHGTEFERQVTSGPVITSVTSINPQASFSISGRCRMCGKFTEAKCSKCNKQSYCSKLCQELDRQLHKTKCGNT